MDRLINYRGAQLKVEFTTSDPDYNFCCWITTIVSGRISGVTTDMDINKNFYFMVDPEDPRYCMFGVDTYTDIKRYTRWMHIYSIMLLSSVVPEGIRFDKR
jgi:hypothetical protein